MASTTAPASASQPITIEITVLSAQGLQSTASFPIFWKRLKPYATLSTAPCRGPPFGGAIEETDNRSPVYATRTDDRGGSDPLWNERFRIPVETTFFANARSSICVRVFNRGLGLAGGGRSQLGWCRIPAGDMVVSPPGKVSFLSYRLRDGRDGTRGHGVVNVAVRLCGLLDKAGRGLASTNPVRTCPHRDVHIDQYEAGKNPALCSSLIGRWAHPSVNMFSSDRHSRWDTGQTVVGIPVTPPAEKDDCRYVQFPVIR